MNSGGIASLITSLAGLVTSFAILIGVLRNQSKLHSVDRSVNGKMTHMINQNQNLLATLVANGITPPVEDEAKEAE